MTPGATGAVCTRADALGQSGVEMSIFFGPDHLLHGGHPNALMCKKNAFEFELDFYLDHLETNDKNLSVLWENLSRHYFILRSAFSEGQMGKK